MSSETGSELGARRGGPLISSGGVAVRAARPGDAKVVASIVYESAPEIYDRLTGGRDRAISLLTAAFSRTGTDTSVEVTTVAEFDGQVAAVLSCFPVQEAGRRASGLRSEEHTSE